MRITAEGLRKLGACRDGINFVRHLLPAEIYTDPEENIPLAIRLVNRYDTFRIRATLYERNLIYDLDFLVWYIADVNIWFDRPYSYTVLSLSLRIGDAAPISQKQVESEIMIIAQILSWIAELLKYRKL